MKLPFHDADPAHRDFQYLEDLSTAYWYSEVLFAALELNLFELLEQGHSALQDLAIAAACRQAELKRLLNVLERLELVQQYSGQWFNSQVARMFLIPQTPSYLGHFLLYRRYMQPRWNNLVAKVSLENTQRTQPLAPDADYAVRNFNYVKSTDALMRQKAEEIAALLGREKWTAPVLDVGGGAGTLSRRLLQSLTRNRRSEHDPEDSYAVLFELPEVIRVAKQIYPDNADWRHIRTYESDFRTYDFGAENRFGLIIMSNFLHAYGGREARQLLLKALTLLRQGGLLLIHDYFPDRFGRSPQKGPLYDLNMMLNTFNGECHRSAEIAEWLREAGMSSTKIRDLASDTSVILTRKDADPAKTETIHPGSDLDEWTHIARGEGFRQAALLSPQKIVTAPWVRIKCRFGCGLYGKDLQCPPRGMDHRTTREMLDSYTWALLLEGTPPGRDFHDRLLRLEKKAFLNGFHKAFIFGAGPCPLCPSCPEDGTCRHPELARPAMEGSGIDVYTTARQAGIHLEPVTGKMQYVKYIGLLLLE